jgi:hypothetical protein
VNVDLREVEVCLACQEALEAQENRDHLEARESQESAERTGGRDENILRMT